MKTYRICLALLVLATCLSVSAAFGEDCDELNLVIKPETTFLDAADYDFLAEWFGVGPFGWCWSQPVVGTIQGEWIGCGNMDLAITDPFGLGIAPLSFMYANPSILRTGRGDLYVVTLGVSAYDPDLLLAIGEVGRWMGGTDAYEGASGWSEQTYDQDFKGRSRGFLCVPD